jgi:hypothetical protein
MWVLGIPEQADLAVLSIGPLSRAFAMPHPKTSSRLSVLCAPLLLGEVGSAGVVDLSFVPRVPAESAEEG